MLIGFISLIVAITVVANKERRYFIDIFLTWKLDYTNLTTNLMIPQPIHMSNSITPYHNEKPFKQDFPKLFPKSMLSSNKEIFDEAQGEYDDHLKGKWVKGTNGILGTILPCFWQFQCKNYLLIWP